MLSALIGIVTFIFGLVGGIWSFLGDLALWVFLRFGHIAVRDWAWRLPFVPFWAEEALLCFRWGALGGLIFEHLGNVILKGLGSYLTIKTEKTVALPTLDRSTNIIVMCVLAPIIFVVHRFIQYWFISIPAAIVVFCVILYLIRKRHP